MTVFAAKPESLPSADVRFVVVEASAGTGKTYFLEHRVVDLVLAGAELGQILLVTFTDKAVAELRLRIRDLFDRLARQTASDPAASTWTIDDAARARLHAAITAFDNAPIYTIHGFCYRVLVEDAFAARRLFDQTQITDEVAFDHAFAALLRERFANAGPERELLAAYLKRGDTVDTLRDLLLACARNGAEPRAYDIGDVRALGGALRDVFGTPAARDAIAARIKEKRWIPNWLQSIGDAVAAWDDTSAGALALCGAIRDDGPKLLTRAQTAGLAAVADVLQRAIDTVSLDEVIASAMLPPILARVAEDKSETGQFDYNDMLKLVRDALHGPRGAELGARLRARTPWVMIDEFQDTDEVQWDIFRTVWTAEGARGLTIVGDPKQAIYGFRGADVATYERARTELVAMGAERVTLDVNRRSTSALVDAVNRILLPSPLAKALFDGAIAYEPVRASGNVEPPPGAPVRVLAITGAGSHDEWRAALANAIASEIDALGAGGVPRADSMVLVRNANEAAQIAAALRARGIACALVESDALFDTREAHELRSVLAAIAAPRDRSARLRALRTRFFDVSWPELMRVVDAPDHHPLIARLFDWAALAARRAYEPLFRRLLEDSRFAERALVLGGGERAIVNTWHLLELLLEEVARSRSDLHELVVRLERWIAGGAELPDDRDVQRAETDADAVRILTVHKAKGLEAPYVFFYGGLSAPPPSRVFALHEGAQRRLLVGQQSDTTKQRLSEEREAEDQRLAYVALTRAKLRLYLPIYPDAPDKRSMYVQVQRCLDHVAGLAPASFARLEIACGAAPLSPAPADALADFAPPSAPDAPELPPIRGARARLEMLSYTRLAHEIEPGTAIDAAEFAVEITADAAPEPARDELPRGIDSGLFLHALFEHVELAAIRRARDAAAWLAEPETAALLAAYGREHGIADAYYEHAARIVYRTLAQPLDLAGGAGLVGRASLPPLAHATAIAREVEFAYPLPDERGLVTGFIDALVAYGDELWVLDYKSDSLAGDPAKTALDHVQAHYQHQHRLYALAADRVRGARRLGGMLFAFVRYGVTAVLPIDDAHLAEWTRWLATVRTEANP